MAYSLNLLQIVQIICDELGLNRPSTVVNSTDTQIRQIYSLVNRALRELQQNYDWTFLQSEYDLYVAQPALNNGDVALSAYTINNVAAAGFPGGIPATLAANPNLWVVNGQFIPVATRLTGVSLNGGEYSFTMDQPATGTELQTPITFSQDTYPEPIDFSRFINQTWWDRTNRWALMGPDSPVLDQWHRSGIVTIGPRRHFRQIGYNGLAGDFNSDFSSDFSGAGIVNNYRIWPAPGATDTPLDLAYEYISSNIVLSSSGVPQPTFQADTDFPICDYNFLILETKWRFFQIKGFDYLPMQMESRDFLDRAFAFDGGSKTLSLPSRRANLALTTGIVSDGNWPGPGNAPGGN